MFDLLTNPKEILVDENGWVKGMKVIKMELGEPDASGRRRPVEIPGSEYEIDLDTVIMSLGTSPNPLICFYNKRSGDKQEKMYRCRRRERTDFQSMLYLPVEMPLQVLLLLSLLWVPVKQEQKVSTKHYPNRTYKNLKVLYRY